MDIKLYTQETINLSRRELAKTTGGNPNAPCGCACRYANEPGGSSYGDNGNANDAQGLHSPGGTLILNSVYDANGNPCYFYSWTY